MTEKEGDSIENFYTEGLFVRQSYFQWTLEIVFCSVFIKDLGLKIYLAF